MKLREMLDELIAMNIPGIDQHVAAIEEEAQKADLLEEPVASDMGEIDAMEIDLEDEEMDAEPIELEEEIPLPRKK